jgi:NAD(P)-dependent dehydrogenase (short-subunit alcohol dehydrogenase family)
VLVLFDTINVLLNVEMRYYMKTVLITGGARGIGKGISEKFAQNGYNVVINYSTSEEKTVITGTFGMSNRRKKLPL